MENTKEYLEALLALDCEFRAAPAITSFQACLLETNFGVRVDWSAVAPCASLWS